MILTITMSRLVLYCLDRKGATLLRVQRKWCNLKQTKLDVGDIPHQMRTVILDTSNLDIENITVDFVSDLITVSFDEVFGNCIEERRLKWQDKNKDGLYVFDLKDIQHGFQEHYDKVWEIKIKQIIVINDCRSTEEALYIQRRRAELNLYIDDPECNQLDNIIHSIESQRHSQRFPCLW